MQSNWATFTDKFDLLPICFVFHGLKFLNSETIRNFSKDPCAVLLPSQSLTSSPRCLSPQGYPFHIPSPLPPTLSGISKQHYV